jgi:hypothetical protein
MAQRLGSVIANSAESAAEFWGVSDYVPQLTGNNDAGLVFHSQYDSNWKAYEAFDGGVNYQSSASAYRTFGLSDQQQAAIGWYDAQGVKGPAILRRVVIENYQDSNGFVYEIGDFTVKGYNPLTELWEEIDSIVTYNSNTEALYFDIASQKAYEGFRLDIGRRVNDQVIIQEIRFEAASTAVLEKVGIETATLDNLSLIARALDATAGVEASQTGLIDSINTEIDQTVADVVAQLNTVRAGTTGVLTLETLRELGIDIVNEYNLAQVETALASSAPESSNTLANIQAIAVAAINTWSENQILDIVTQGSTFDAGASAYSFVPLISNRADPDAEGLVIESLNNVNVTGENYHDVYKLFDDVGFNSTSTQRYFGETGNDGNNPSASTPTLLGWFDTSGQKLSQLDYIEMTTWNQNDGNRLPQTFNVEGYDAQSGEWKFIQRFVDVELPANIDTTEHVLRVDLDRGGLYSGFRIAVEDTRDNYNTIQLTELDFYTTDIQNLFAEAGWDFVKETELKRAANYIESLALRADAATLTADTVESLLEVYLAENRVLDYAAASDLNYVDIPTVSDFTLAGINGVDANNLSDHLAMIAHSSESIAAISLGSEALINGDYQSNTLFEVLHLAKLRGYEFTNNSLMPELDDFAVLGITGVTQSNLLQVASRLDEAIVSEKNSIAGIQAIVDSTNLNSTFTEVSEVNTSDAFRLNSEGINLATRYIWMFDNANNGETRSYTSLDALSDGVNVALEATSSGVTTSTSLNNFSNATDGGYAEPYNGMTDTSSNLVYLAGTDSYNRIDLGAVYALDEIGIWARSDNFWSESTGIRGFFGIDAVSNSYTTLQNSLDVAEEYLGNEFSFTAGNSYSTKSGTSDAWGNFQPGSTGETQRLVNGALLIGEASPVLTGQLNFDLPADIDLAVSINGTAVGFATVNGRQWSFDFDGVHSFSTTAATTMQLTAVDADGQTYASTSQAIQHIDLGSSSNDGAPTISSTTEIYENGIYFEATVTDYFSLGSVMSVFVDGQLVGHLTPSGTTKSVSGWLDVPLAAGDHIVTSRIDNLVSGETGTLSNGLNLTVQTAEASIDTVVTDTTGDTTPDLVIDLEGYTAGDDYYLVIDGQEVDIPEPTASDISGGQMTLNEFDVTQYDATLDGTVDIAVKVNHSNGTQYISEDYTYVYEFN